MNEAIIPTYSNIKTKGLKNNHLINASMIIKKELKDVRKKRDGTSIPVYEHKVNIDFWRKLANDKLNVIIDEAHVIFSSRRSMSKLNTLMGDWLSLLRRILGNREGTFGNLTLISQLSRRIDVIGREMANQVIYHICYWVCYCKKCNGQWQENSEMPEISYSCRRCKHPYIKKYNHIIEIIYFESPEHFTAWYETKQKSYYKKQFLKNVGQYFGMYDSLQYDNLFQSEI